MQMHYKITRESHPEQHAIRLLLDGKFSEDAIPELKKSILAAKDAHQRIYIDLSEVTLVDRKAVRYFSETASEDVKLVNCPVYLRRWIAQVCDEQG